MEIPQSIGEGFVRWITLGDDFRLLVHRYTLKEEFVIQGNPTLEMNDLLIIFFYNNGQS